MAVFRVEKNKNYTVMSNHHLRDTSLSLKAKGLLSLMLSLPDDWDYTTKGLSMICRDGIDSINATIKELEEAGYIIRQRNRNEKGQLTDTEYTIMEEPLTSGQNPIVENPILEKPRLVKHDQLNTNLSNTNQSSKDQSFRGWAEPSHGEEDGYKELILENIGYEALCYSWGEEKADEIADVMTDAVMSNSPTIRIGGEERAASIVKSRLLKVNQFHVEEIFERMETNTKPIKNRKSYLLTVLYHAPERNNPIMEPCKVDEP